MNHLTSTAFQAGDRPVESTSHHAETSFSKPSDFARLLVPITLAVATAMMADSFSPFFVRLGLSGLLAATLLMGVGVLHAVSRFLQNEEKRNS